MQVPNHRAMYQLSSVLVDVKKKSKTCQKMYLINKSKFKQLFAVFLMLNFKEKIDQKSKENCNLYSSLNEYYSSHWIFTNVSRHCFIIRFHFKAFINRIQSR